MVSSTQITILRLEPTSQDNIISMQSVVECKSVFAHTRLNSEAAHPSSLSKLHLHDDLIFVEEDHCGSRYVRAILWGDEPNRSVVIPLPVSRIPLKVILTPINLYIRSMQHRGMLLGITYFVMQTKAKST